MSRGANRLSAAIQIALSIAFLGFGLAAALWFGPRALVQSTASSRYEPVSAVVESIAVGERRRTKGAPRYDVRIEYRYQAGGQSYVGTTWRVGGSPSSRRREEIDELVAQHPVGSTIEVFVDPEDARVAVVERGGTDSAWFLIAMGCLFSGLGALGVWRGLGRLTAPSGEASEHIAA